MIIGSAYFIDPHPSAENGAARLFFLSVLPRHRNKGYGREIVKQLKKAYNKGSGFSLSCRENLIDFYKRCGLIEPQKSNDDDRFYTLHSKRSAINSNFIMVTLPDFDKALSYYNETFEWYKSVSC